MGFSLDGGKMLFFSRVILNLPEDEELTETEWHQAEKMELNLIPPRAVETKICCTNF